MGSACGKGAAQPANTSAPEKQKSIPPNTQVESNGTTEAKASSDAQTSDAPKADPKTSTPESTKDKEEKKVEKKEEEKPKEEEKEKKNTEVADTKSSTVEEPKAEEKKQEPEETKKEEPPKETGDAKPKTPATFDNQAAGHGTITKTSEDKIVKLVSKHEFDFYNSIGDYPDIQKFAPKFFGSKTEDDKSYVELEDITYNHRKPCIMDVKMGTSSVTDDAAPEKKERAEKRDKESTTATLGIRICGMKVYQQPKDEFKSYGKSWGQKITQDTIQQSLQEYFDNGAGVRTELVPLFVSKLNEILESQSKQNKLKLFSSSLLFVYDGHQEPNETPKVDIRMIDFAHTQKIEQEDGRDEGYILGLKNLIQYLENIK